VAKLFLNSYGFGADLFNSLEVFMVRSTASKVSLFAMAAFSPIALAGTASFGGEEVKFGVEYRAEYRNANNGLTEVGGKAAPAKASATSNISMPAANLTMSGKLSKDVSFDANYSMLGGLNWFFVDYKSMDMLTVRAGKDAANLGGWENENDLYDIFAKSIYNTNKRPLSASPFVEARLSFGDAANVNIQLLDDVVFDKTTDPLRYNNSNKRPAMLVEYTGNFGMVSPLVQFGQYDANKSMFYTIGAKLSVADLVAYIDIVGDTVAIRKTPTSSDADEYAQQSIVADLRYTMSKVEYFLKYSSYARTEPSAAKSEVNTSATVTDFDDNGSVIGVGARCNWVEAFNPYLALEMRSGDFNDSDNKKESRSDMNILLGVLGKM
jgi:hypothetical protein